MTEGKGCCVCGREYREVQVKWRPRKVQPYPGMTMWEYKTHKVYTAAATTWRSFIEESFHPGLIAYDAFLKFAFTKPKQKRFCSEDCVETFFVFECFDWYESRRFEIWLHEMQKSVRRFQANSKKEGVLAASQLLKKELSPQKTSL